LNTIQHNNTEFFGHLVTRSINCSWNTVLRSYHHDLIQDL